LPAIENHKNLPENVSADMEIRKMDTCCSVGHSEATLPFSQYKEYNGSTLDGMTHARFDSYICTLRVI
jgi:hypothetical protein